MSDERLAELFAEAWELPTAERATFLDAACGDDASLRAEVTSLLAASERAPEVFAPPDPTRLLALLDEDEADVPTHAGPFRVIRELGRGGMGTVYLGEREGSDFAQRVAIKVVRRGIRSEELVARFLRERRILATLEHPSVARLVDGGVLDDGRPWLAMEHVDGEPLIAWCDKRRLGVDERLRVFERVGRAVEFAHGRLVAHLDLKPSNVLVTDDGTVKLLDFGIAKLLDEPGGSGAHAGGGVTAEDVTRTGGRPLTPRYAAPEQWRGEPVSVATDVYALGVLLGELLTGRAPSDGRDPGAPALPPSQLVARDGAAGGAALRDRDPVRLARRLRGDLDAIVLRALAPHPSDRYASAGGLVDDLGRHLAGQPITARPGSRSYRLGRFVRRHRLGVGLATLAAAALVIGTSLALWQAHEAGHERDRARREAARAASARDFLIDLLEGANPAIARGKDLTASEILESGLDRIDAALGTDPEGQVELLTVLGTTFQRLGRYARAGEVFERALAVRPSRDPLATARLLARLGETRSVEGRIAEAEPLLRHALLIRRTELPADHRDVASSMDALAVFLHYQGRLDEAEPLYREALAIRLGKLGLHHDDTLATTQNLANLEYQRGHHAIAQQLHREVFVIRIAKHGERHPEIARSLSSLALVTNALGEYAAAIALYRRGLAIDAEVLGEDHPDVATRRNNLAGVLRSLGELAEAEVLFRRVLASDQASLGDAHPYVAMTLDNLAAVLIERGELGEARVTLDRAEVILRASGRQRGATWANHRQHRATLLLAEGDLDAALVAIEEAIAEYATAKVDPMRLAGARRRRGTIQARRGARDLAEQDLRGALAAQRTFWPAGHPEIANTLIELGWLWVDTASTSDAVALFEEAAEIRNRSYPITSWRRAEAELLWHACREVRSAGDEHATLLASVIAALGDAHPYVLRIRRLADRQK
jgi:eukaryotic-like serine/threonine-protein kinase